MDALITIFIILVLIGIGAAIMWFWKSSQNKSAKSAKDTPAKLDIRQMQAGGVLSLKGVGPSAEDFDVVVTARHEYEEDGFRWFELECEKGAEKVFLEVEDDDELDISISLEKLRLSDIDLTADQLESIVAKDKGSVQFRDETFEYEDWGGATFMRGGDHSKREQLTYYDFENAKGTRSLCVETWGSSHEVWLSESLPESRIEIYGTSG